ncbi:TAXI family TRAP transporter solute-binding subunit [Bradyrhizobium diazoefficiens]|nr:TAXI family TRAP transporter solute-binding subunit [Bradyrhizobium diazoefficiens]MBR0968383.1 TAXI family TRAP transporter solute-binding subunit [Bradyrhizobium diazoefficiens]MBR0981755.1 TAXI family TRAP transporter solute-binding subunit [Bradyrhizobium diazoefficiens]MBR1011160.1 TAXI family TRAP transporter solute-binding subunit [Bradyrhizobium diazoefficiens]MBR1017708.1 TAXI family TRAP transporter solute-binding subunit [Bradyrhizobium diazoefficiens]MBR1055057.1 TAXI family TRA
MPVPSNLSVTRNAARRRHRFGPWLALASLLSVMTVVLALAYWLWQPATLRIAVGPAGSDDQMLVLAIARAFDAKAGSVRLVPVQSDGTLQSLNLLATGKADLAVARGDLTMPPDASSVAILRRNFVVLWAPGGRKGAAKSKVTDIAALSGRRIGMVGLGDANPNLLRVILAESGVNPQKVTITQFGTDHISEMIQDPMLDAFMMVGARDDKTIAETIAATTRLRGEPKFLPVDVSEAIAERHPLYESEEIPTGAFAATPQRPDDKIETIAVNHLIVAQTSLSEDAVAAFTRELFIARPALAKELPGASHIQKPDTDKDAALPAHPGAAAYIDGNERSFMDKYSDYIWGVVLLLSGLGSVAAWLRHYLRREERSENALHRDRLLKAISSVREASSLSDLAAMQRAADDILRETLVCHEDGAIEDGDLAAFGLVLAQFHQAIVDQRAEIARTADAEAMKSDSAALQPFSISTAAR